MLSIDKMLYRVEAFILVTTLALMVFIAFLQVILRNFFNAGILWGDTLARHLVLWVGFLGASLATFENRHININVLTRFLSPAWQKRSQLVVNLFSAVISALLTRAAFVFVRDERAADTRLFLDIPLWLFMSIILIGFFIITVRFVLKTVMPGTFSSTPAGGE